MLKRFPLQQKIFYAQMIINSIIILVYTFVKGNPGLRFFIIINILGLFIVKLPSRRKFDKINWVVQILAQSMLIPAAVSFFISLTKWVISWNSPLGLLVIILYSVIMFIPYTFTLVVPVRTSIMRIILLIFLFFFNAASGLDFMTQDTGLANVPTIKTFSETLFDSALIVAVIVSIAMYRWGFGFPGYRLRSGINYWILSAIFIFTIAFAINNAFSTGTTLKTALFSYDFSTVRLTISKFLSGIEAGIAEEFVFRFGILNILLSVFKRSNNKYLYAALISSLLFGLIHGSNILAGQAADITGIQVIFAFAMGMYFAAVYIYTSNFYLIMFFHALLDTLVFLTTSNTLMVGKVTFDIIILNIIESTIFVIIAILLLVRTKTEQRSTFTLFS